MRSVAGAIVVLAGSLVMGLAFKEIPKEPIPTIFSLGLIVIGLIVIFTDKRTTSDKTDKSKREG